MTTSKIKSPYLRQRARQKALQLVREKQTWTNSSSVSPVTVFGLIIAAHDVLNNGGRGMKKITDFFVNELFPTRTN